MAKSQYSNVAKDTYSLESRSVGMASAKSVGTAQSDNFLVTETHSVENIPDMFVSLRCIGKTTIGGTGRDIFIGTAGSPGDDRPAHFLDRANSSKGPEIRVCDPRELLLDFLEMVTGDDKSGIGSVLGFRGESLQLDYSCKGEIPS